MVFIQEIIYLKYRKDGVYVINLDEYESIGTHWIALYGRNNNNVTYFNIFGVKYIPKGIKIFIGNKSITTTFYRIQAYNSIMSGCFCTGFIDFMLKVKVC